MSLRAARYGTALERRRFRGSAVKVCGLTTFPRERPCTDRRCPQAAHCGTPVLMVDEVGQARPILLVLDRIAGEPVWVTEQRCCGTAVEGRDALITYGPSARCPDGSDSVWTTRDRSGRSTIVGNVGDDDAVGKGHLCGTEFEDAARLSIGTDRTVARDERPDQRGGATSGEDSGPRRHGGRVGVAGSVGEHLALPQRGLAAGVNARARHAGSGGRVPIHLAVVQGQHAHVFQGGRRSARRGGGVAGNPTAVEREGADI